MHNAHSSVVVDGVYTSRMTRQTTSQAHFEPQLVVDQPVAEFRFVFGAGKHRYVYTRVSEMVGMLI